MDPHGRAQESQGYRRQRQQPGFQSRTAAGRVAVDSPAEDKNEDNKKSEPAPASPSTIPAIYVAKDAKENAGAEGARTGFTISRRLKRRAVLAATIAIAAGFGAVIGAFAAGSYFAPQPAPQRDAAATEERTSLQKTVAHLSKELSSLKTSVDTAAKNNVSQIGRIADPIRANRTTPETTGSIAKSAPVVAAVPTVPGVTPTPKESPPRPQIVQGWTVRGVAERLCARREPRRVLPRRARRAVARARPGRGGPPRRQRMGRRHAKGADHRRNHRDPRAQ